MTEIHLRDTQERLSSYEQRSIDQAQQIASLNTKLDQTTTSMDDVRDKWHESTGEKKTMVARLDVQERRIHETEQQNRELMEMVGKKEDNIRRLQGRVEELLHGVASASTHNELGKSEHRRQLEHVKDKAASKVQCEDSLCHHNNYCHVHVYTVYLCFFAPTCIMLFLSKLCQHNVPTPTCTHTCIYNYNTI